MAKYKSCIEVPLPPGCKLTDPPYPYINATTLEDIAQGKQVWIVGLLDDGDELEQ